MQDCVFVKLKGLLFFFFSFRLSGSTISSLVPISPPRTRANLPTFESLIVFKLQAKDSHQGLEKKNFSKNGFWSTVSHTWVICESTFPKFAKS